MTIIELLFADDTTLVVELGEMEKRKEEVKGVMRNGIIWLMRNIWNSVMKK